MTDLHDDTGTAGQQPRIFTRDFCLMFVASILVVVAYFTLFSTMARFAVLSFAASDAIAGLTASVFLISSMVARVFCGRYAEPFGLKRASVAACILMLAACALYFVSSANLGFLMVSRIMHGFSFGVANTTIPSLVAKSLPREAAGTGTGYFMLSNTLGGAIGPWIGLTLANEANYTAMFVICTVCAVVSLATMVLVGDDRPAGNAAAPGSVGAGATAARNAAAPRGISTFVDPGIFAFALYMFLIGFGYSGLSAFLNGYSVEIGQTAIAPYVYVLYAGTLLVVRPLAGKLMDSRGENAVLYPSFVLMALGYVVFALVQNELGMVLIGPLAAVGFGNAMSTGLAIITRDSDPAKTTIGVSTFYLLCDAGVGIGPFFLGMAVTAFGYANMFLICAAIVLASLATYALVHGRSRRR